MLKQFWVPYTDTQNHIQSFQRHTLYHDHYSSTCWLITNWYVDKNIQLLAFLRELVRKQKQFTVVMVNGMRKKKQRNEMKKSQPSNHNFNPHIIWENKWVATVKKLSTTSIMLTLQATLFFISKGKQLWLCCML